MGNADIQEAQRKLLGRLNNIPAIRELEFYLAGGTGLNFYLMHRFSVDEDFFTPKPFDPSELLLLLKANFQVTEPQISKGTLHCLVDNIRCSFFHYPYPLIGSTTPSPFPTAAIIDIATMKLAAIVGRGTRKDFYDLYCIMAAGVSFASIWTAYERKFSLTLQDIYPVLKSLTYFDDAETEVLGLEKEEQVWQQVKAHFTTLSQQLLDGRLGRERQAGEKPK